MTNFEKVGLFMTTFGQEVKINPSLSSEKINKGCLITFVFSPSE